MKRTISKFFLFSAIGAVGTTVHFLTLISLVHYGIENPVSASAAGFIAGALVNYVLNYRITFKSRNPHYATLSKFFMVALAGLCLNSLIMTAAIQRMHYLLSQALATSIVLIWNFFFSQIWTFKEIPSAK